MSKFVYEIGFSDEIALKTSNREDALQELDQLARLNLDKLQDMWFRIKTSKTTILEIGSSDILDYLEDV